MCTETLATPHTCVLEYHSLSAEGVSGGRYSTVGNCFGACLCTQTHSCSSPPHTLALHAHTHVHLCATIDTLVMGFSFQQVVSKEGTSLPPRVR